MRKLLSILAISTLSVTSISSLKPLLNTNITVANYPLKTQINYLSPEPEDKGVNKIVISKNIIFRWYEWRTSINHETLKKWSECPWNEKESLIYNDLKSNFFTKNWIFYMDSYYHNLAQFFASHTNKMLNTPHSSIYGITTLVDMAKPEFPPTTFGGIWTQSSPINNNASCTQENFVYFGHNHLNVYISRQQWENISNIGKDKDKIYNLIKNFPQDPAWNNVEISQEYLQIMSDMIITNFDAINNKFQNSKDHGWIVKGNTIAECFGIEAQSA